MNLPDPVARKLHELPDKPGCYLLRDRFGQIIYVGKAASLRRRVSSYFRAGTLRSASPKLRGLIRSVADLEIVVLRSEAEAILTEGQLIKDYRPRYNTSFKDDKRFLLLRLDLNQPFPRLQAVRLRREDGAAYFGPYASSRAARACLEFVEKRFGLRRCRPVTPGPADHAHCLDDIVRFCSAPCLGRVSPDEYRRRVDEAAAFLRGERREQFEALESAMREAAAGQDFEMAAALRDTLQALRLAIKPKPRPERSRELDRREADEGLRELADRLGLAAPPRLIECFDVSCISGTHAVAGMVCAVDGVPHPERYRRFRIRTVAGADDPAMMAEAVERRFRRLRADGGEAPGLLLVDGGLTQRAAARRVLAELGYAQLPVWGLAKRYEELVGGPGAPLRLPADSPALKVLQRLRDEAHRFANAYHRLLRARRIRESALDEIPGVGPARKEALLRRFGSVRRLARAPEAEIAAVPGVGPALASQLKTVLAGPGVDGVSE
jgi:excinuclease ABC subunit C